MIWVDLTEKVTSKKTYLKEGRVYQADIWKEQLDQRPYGRTVPSTFQEQQKLIRGRVIKRSERSKWEPVHSLFRPL